MIQSKLPKVGTTIFTVMSKMANDYNAINLSQGFPDFAVDEKLISLSYFLEPMTHQKGAWSEKIMLSSPAAVIMF